MSKEAYSSRPAPPPTACAVAPSATASEAIDAGESRSSLAGRLGHVEWLLDALQSDFEAMHSNIQKVKVVVEHIITLETWRHNLLPRLLKLSTPVSSFPVYSVVFQEACCLSLLETAMFHVDVAQSLEDAGTDLLDYCIRNITHLLYPINDDIKKYDVDNEDEKFVLQEIFDQVRL